MAKSPYKLIESVKTPLGFFTLIVFVIETGLGGLIVTLEDLDQTMAFLSLVGLLAIVILLVSAMAAFRPDALWGKSYNVLLPATAVLLGNHIFQLIDGYVSNDDGTRQEAYGRFEDLLKLPGYEHEEAKKFRNIFVETVCKAAAQIQKPLKRGAVILRR